MTSLSIEAFINKHLDSFIFQIFSLYLAQNESILYYLVKYTENEDFNEDHVLKKAIRKGITNDKFTYDNIENEFGNEYGDVDPFDYYYEILNEDNFPFKKMLEKFTKKNKSNILGKLIKLTRDLWIEERIVWVNAYGDSPPYYYMYEFIKNHKAQIKGMASWYTQNELLADYDESAILFNPCDTEAHLNEGYCLDKESYLDMKKRIMPYLDKHHIDYIDYIDSENRLKIKFTGNIRMPNFTEEDLS